VSVESEQEGAGETTLSSIMNLNCSTHFTLLVLMLVKFMPIYRKFLMVCNAVCMFFLRIWIC